jgi:uncharacterized protein (TIGR03083 family)
VEPVDHIRALELDGQALAAAADLAGLHAAVPSCPGWQVRDLLRHIGYVHRWAADYVTEQRLEMADELSEAEQLSGGPPDDKLISWFGDGHAALVAALTAAAPDLACWTFLPAPSPLAFWARRQAHETAIHRADAELASGQVIAFAAEFAADGVDELVIGLFGRSGSTDDAGAAAEGAGSAPADVAGSAAADGAGSAVAEGAGSAPVAPAEPERTLVLRAADTGQDWHIRLSADGRQVAMTGRGACPAGSVADCTLTAPASDLYLLLWNRADPATAAIGIGGDAGLLRAWQDGMHVNWG